MPRYFSRSDFGVSAVGFQLSDEYFYHQVSKLKLTRHLQDQLNRAASSVALNLAEGNSRQTRPDKVKFFNIAFASLRESQAVLLIAQNRNQQLDASADALAAHIYRLIKSWG